MSKVKKETIEAAILKFISSIAQTMPSTSYKFIFGSVSALAAFGNSKKIDEFLSRVSDSDGYIELESLKVAIDGGFKASGGKISMDLFQNSSGLLSMFVKPITLTITKDDIDQLIKEVEENSIKDVRLNNENSRNSEENTNSD